MCPYVKRKFVFALLFICFFAPSHSRADERLEEAIDLHCLKKAYPGIKGIELDGQGGKWIIFDDGDRVSYSGKPGDPGGLDRDVKASMEQPYPLEPERCSGAPLRSPGRIRSYELFEKLYGASPEAVKAGLEGVRFMGKTLSLSAPAARAFRQAAAELEGLATPGMKKFLAPEGGYYWRRIAGESAMSAHSYGIALDLGVNASPYWRWSRKMPHPLQKAYPEEIVRIMEKHGFIWGGKWREYDLMHFEYRPELICKGAMLKNPCESTQGRAGALK